MVVGNVVIGISTIDSTICNCLDTFLCGVVVNNISKGAVCYDLFGNIKIPRKGNAVGWNIFIWAVNHNNVTIQVRSGKIDIVFRPPFVIVREGGEHFYFTMRQLVQCLGKGVGSFIFEGQPGIFF